MTIKRITPSTLGITNFVPIGPSRTAVAAPQDSVIPEVNCEMDGDIVRSITVRCRCGEVVQILCEYHLDKSN